MHQINSRISGETNSVSSYAISLLKNKYSSLQTKEFRKTVATVLAKGFEKEKDGYTRREYINAIRDEMPNIIPDGYIVNEQENKIIIFEIEDTNFLTPYKIDCIVDLWQMLDFESWNLEARVTDRYGLHEQPLPLMDYYYNSLQKLQKTHKERLTKVV